MSLVEWFKSLRGKDWGEETYGSLVRIERGDVEKLLEDIASSYRETNYERLAETLGPDAELVFRSQLGESFREEKRGAVGYLQETCFWFSDGFTYPTYRMTLVDVLESSETRWVVRCLAEFHQRKPGYSEVRGRNDEILTIGIHCGRAVVLRAEVSAA
ncbi:MAG: hypothetical protein KDA57_20820 [Planctomycetales bacterium]|nr:hypothetical protein [Planctomycetales bacterium]